MSWAKEYHLHGAKTIILFIIYCLAGLCGLTLLALLAIADGHWTRWFLAVWLTVLCVYRLFFARFVSWSNSYKMMAKTYGVTEWIRTVEFTDREIICKENDAACMTFRYDNIKRIKEKGNIVFIFFNDNLTLRLYKDAFTEGSWEECNEKLNAMRQ